MPTNIPTTRETITREDIERSVNATDAEDALKYLPSLLVRKRYIGDYNHAILCSRASGTGNSARSAIYADGILLSNYLGNGVSGLSYAPRWGLVTPEEIERVDCQRLRRRSRGRPRLVDQPQHTEGVTKYATADARVLWRIDRQWSASFGIDNLNNDQYWNFHNYPQRSHSAELTFDI